MFYEGVIEPAFTSSATACVQFANNFIGTCCVAKIDLSPPTPEYARLARAVRTDGIMITARHICECCKLALRLSEDLVEW